jgi:hypothetical protein
MDSDGWDILCYIILRRLSLEAASTPAKIQNQSKVFSITKAKKNINTAAGLKWCKATINSLPEK